MVWVIWIAMQSRILIRADAFIIYFGMVSVGSRLYPLTDRLIAQWVIHSNYHWGVARCPSWSYDLINRISCCVAGAFILNLRRKQVEGCERFNHIQKRAHSLECTVQIRSHEVVKWHSGTLTIKRSHCSDNDGKEKKVTTDTYQQRMIWYIIVFLWYPYLLSLLLDLCSSSPAPWYSYCWDTNGTAADDDNL